MSFITTTKEKKKTRKKKVQDHTLHLAAMPFMKAALNLHEDFLMSYSPKHPSPPFMYGTSAAYTALMHQEDDFL